MSDTNTSVPPSVSQKRSNRPLFAGVAVAVIFAISFALNFYQHRLARGYVIVGDDLRVNVGVAANEPTRERGLSGRAGLAADEGMYFIFDKPLAYAFWMKDMRFPIDIIWIFDGKIVDLSTNLPVPVAGQQLPTFAPRVPVDRVLEVPAGFAQTHGLRTGLPVTEHLLRQ
jgi:hypothetical protein